MHSMTHPTNYQMVDRITPVRRPAKPKGLSVGQRIAVLAMSTGAGAVGVTIGTVLATLIGLR